MKLKKWLVGVAIALSGLSVAACDAPECPAGQVAEYDDDGWECEPDANNNGVDDEEERDD